MTKFIDVTLPFSADLPCWPGDPVAEIELISSTADGGSCNVTKISTHVHYGTRVDAPVHFVPGGKGADQLTLETLIGPAEVACFETEDKITAADLDGLALPAGTKRLLLKTRNSALWDLPTHPFERDYVAFTPDASEWVVANGIDLVGIDYLSIERFDEPGHATHHILLGKEVVVIEGLDLRQVEAGSYHLICLPMKLKDADGAFARVVLQRE